MNTNQKSGSAPVIEYEWDGKKWLYASKTYSTPPAYSVNEQIPIYLNRVKNPGEIIIDTFLGRWFLIALFGFLGLMFFCIPLLIYHVIKPGR
jgi:phosphatidylglycerophosphatase A